MMDPRDSLAPLNRYTTVIFDLGDVLFTWSPSSPHSPLPARKLRDILRSFHFFEYEKGNHSEEEVYSLVSQEFRVPAEDVKAAFHAARESLQANFKLLEVIRELRASGLSIYAMSNISAPDWEVLSTKATPEDWALFDHTFTSAAARERKPNIGYYRHVIKETGIEPCRTIFVDDKIENVVTARSLGMHGIIYDDLSKVVQQLKNLCGDPILRGKNFLEIHKTRLVSMTSDNVEILENYSQFLILEATDDESLIDYVKHDGRYNFFKNGKLPSGEIFPDDFDTTAIALTVCKHVDFATKQKVMNEMLDYQNSDGIMQVYYDHSRPRIDPVVCVNILTLFYENGRGHELLQTLDWVEQILLNHAYISGTYYFSTADQFLFFLSRLLRNSTGAAVRRRLEPIFKERIMERFGAEADAHSLAGRILAATVVNMVDQRDLNTLLSMQCEDGSWRGGWYYKYGSSRTLVRNDGLTTALSIRAIQAAELVQKMQSKSAVKPFEPLSTIFSHLPTLRGYFGF